MESSVTYNCHFTHLLLEPGDPQEEQQVEPPATVLHFTLTGYEADQAPSTPAVEDIFGTTSPLTPVSSPQGKYMTIVASPDVAVCPTYTASSNTRQKRKRKSSRPAAAKSSRRKRELQPQRNQEDVSDSEVHMEGDPADQSFWPPVIGDTTKENMVGLTHFQFYIAHHSIRNSISNVMHAKNASIMSAWDLKGTVRMNPLGLVHFASSKGADHLR